MNDSTKRKTLFIVICLLISFVFNGCFYEREYRDDICVKLENSQAEIIIREWSFLSGSGAEIYYKYDDEEILLGKIQGGDDGYCPFEDGLYSVEVDDNKLAIEWCRFPSDKEKPWEQQVFELPSN